MRRSCGANAHGRAAGKLRGPTSTSLPNAPLLKRTSCAVSGRFRPECGDLAWLALVLARRAEHLLNCPHEVARLTKETACWRVSAVTGKWPQPLGGLSGPSRRLRARPGIRPSADPVSSEPTTDTCR